MVNFATTDPSGVGMSATAAAGSTTLRLSPIASLRFKVWEQCRQRGVGDDIPRFLIANEMSARIWRDGSTGYITFEDAAEAARFRRGMARVLAVHAADAHEEDADGDIA